MAKRGDWMETYTGQKFWPLDPSPDAVRLEDIAHALAHQCRFNGHTRFFYSVAHHALLCAEEARLQGAGPRLVLLTLLHDAAEAYIGDITRPVRRSLNEFATDVITAVEERIQHAIYRAFGIETPSQEEKAFIHRMDNILLATEARDVMRGDGWMLSEKPSKHLRIKPASIKTIRSRFLRTATDLLAALPGVERAR